MRIITVEDVHYFQADSKYTRVVTLDGMNEKHMADLAAVLKKLKPGTRIVSNTFDMGEWRTDDTVTLQGCDRWCTALLWIVPAKVEGSWRSPQGDP